MTAEPQPVRVFFSYSHQDDAHRFRLATALRLLERQGLIDTWSDRKLLPSPAHASPADEQLDLIPWQPAPEARQACSRWSRRLKPAASAFHRRAGFSRLWFLRP